MILGLFSILISFFGIGAVLPLALWKNKNLANKVSNGFAAAGSIIGVVLGAYILLTKALATFSFTTGLPFFDITVRLDMLAGFFILLIGTIGLASSIYGINYMRQYFKNYNISVFGFFYNLFLLSLFLVVTATNGLYFIFVWEIMSLASFFLVIFEHHHFETIRAGILYFIMTHAATAFILAGFLLLFATTHTLDFWQIKNLAPTIPNSTKDLVFLFLLIGFGTKAGIIPLHIWLPRAHTAAPSHVSALMSGVMIKLGIFMLFRLFIDILPGATVWWGIVILLVGGFSSLLGVLYAFAQHDIKSLLAYHSIENIGIILLGLGGSVIFISMHLPALALLAAVAGLFHTFNHGVFKSLLFLSAGSVISATGTRDIEKYGGLIKRMPYTALFFLVGAVAISGLPPLNGFVSEWLTFQSLFAGINVANIGIRSLFLFGAGFLALTGGLAAACFVKAFGITFLARPRTKLSEAAKESSWFMTLPMGFLAVLCFVIAFFAGGVVNILQEIVLKLQVFNPSDLIKSNGIEINVHDGFAQLNMPVVIAILVLITGVVYLVASWINSRQKVTKGETWDCGHVELMPYMEITATGFSKSLILIFRGLFQPTRQKRVEYIDANIRYFTKSHVVNFMTENIIEMYLYHPLHQISIFVAKKIKQIQGGNLNAYILYIFLTLVALLFWVKFS